MSRKRPSKFSAAKHDPLLMGAPGLDFDNLKPAEVVELTDEQKATAFLSRYLEAEHPIGRYRAYFEASVKGEAWELKELKRFYQQLVVSGKWAEDKFVQVVNSIYRDNQFMTAPVLDARGKMYDHGGLKAPEKPGSSRRRGRI